MIVLTKACVNTCLSPVKPPATANTLLTPAITYNIYNIACIIEIMKFFGYALALQASYLRPTITSSKAHSARGLQKQPVSTSKPVLCAGPAACPRRTHFYKLTQKSGGKSGGSLVEVEVTCCGLYGVWQMPGGDASSSPLHRMIKKAKKEGLR
jgi:hypothetical protein